MSHVTYASILLFPFIWNNMKFTDKLYFLFSGLETKMTLWGQRAIQFNVDAVYNGSNPKPVVALFLGCLMKRYFGTFLL